MNDYSIALFFHMVGALGFFLALGLEWTGLWQLRSALRSQEVRAWMGLLGHRLAQDRQTGSQRITADHRRRARPRSCFSPANVPQCASTRGGG